MRILVISQYFPPDGGGGSKRVSNALQILQKQGHQIEVITAFPHYPHGNVPRSYRKRAFISTTWNDLRVFRVWVPAIPHQGFIRRIIQYVSFAISALIVALHVKHMDIIWAANSNIFSSFPAIIYGILKKAPVVRNVDDLWPETAIEEGYLKEGRLTKIGRFLAKCAYRFCDAITPISNGYKKEIVRKYRVGPEKIHVVEVGVDTDTFRPINLSTVHSNQNSRFEIMYSGILGTGYDFDYMLSAAKILKNENSIVFTIRGFGELKEEIQRKIDSAALQNVFLSTDFMTLKELVIKLNAADILFLPMKPMKAHEAGLPTKLIEYMAIGKPIICSSKGEVANLVMNANCGIAVSPSNPREAVRAILKLKEDDLLREELGKKGRLFVESNLSLNQIGQKLEEVFNFVLKKRGKIN